MSPPGRAKGGGGASDGGGGSSKRPAETPPSPALSATSSSGRVSPIKRKRKPSITEESLKVPDLSNDQVGYLNLTTHSANFLADPIDLKWGEEDPEQRGPVMATTRHPTQRNAIGAHSGSYCVYRALAVAAGKLNTNYMPKLGSTRPVCEIGPFASWSDPSKIGTMDPKGHLVTDVFDPWLRKGYDVRPTIAVTKAHIDLPEVREAVRLGRLVPDGKVLSKEGQSFITKCAVEPVWHLPEIARRFGVNEAQLRETLFKETNMMYPELVTREDLKVAGIQDTRFQSMMPDPLHWLGVTKIHRFISMSDMKYDAIVSTGIKIVERVEIPPELVPKDAQVNEETLKSTKGREYDYADGEDGGEPGGGGENGDEKPTAEG
ncbi:conserved unknown protein [Ectocarpus siliculosus]|uniref:GTP cyclohydrolase N-terminal domain-containing protein n=1 Tax=Ectocarpus siliculosus TaxID=2880 RepID=D7FLZ3_ECTSI|nr:conserved unknown protein [Ectocarpus siliculosus]|eukprot:CBJ29818.1 conserved unknown protein [Ectocarpus siliculosus]